MKLTRRFFLQSSGLLAAYVGVSPFEAVARAGLVAPFTAKGKTLVIVFLRGGADGLNLVVPFGDSHYRKLRPSLAIDAPGKGNAGALDLDGMFGLHPRLAPLKPFFDSRVMVAAHAVGYDKNTRSHFEEQDVWETGVIGNTVGSDGWLSRHLSTSQGHGRIRAVAIGNTLPRILRGKVPAYALRGVEDLGPPEADGLSAATVKAALEHAYCTPTPGDRNAARGLLADTVGGTLEAIDDLRAINETKYRPTAPYPETDLGRRLMQVAQLIKANVGLEVAEVDFGGWDTHAAQGRGQGGQFGNLAGDLAGALAAFLSDLDDRMDDVVVATITDFGRTAAENGTGGTDHGWANCMFVAGGAVKRASEARPDARPVVTKWPGLAPDQLHQSRDLLHTTDFRDVLAELVRVHLGNANLEKVLPAHTFAPVGLVA